jgi:hypothetical protein
MLKLIRNREPLGNRLAPHMSTLSVSWLNSRFKATAVHRGEVEGEWETAESVQTPAQLGSVIRQAVRQTGYRGSSVTLLLAHPRLVQQVVDLPPVHGATRRKLLQRQAQQQKLFAGEAAWACQASASGKIEQRVVLHLFPRVLLNQCMEACQKCGLHLTGVVPVSAVLQRQVQQLPLGKNELGVVAAETGGTTTLIVGHADGRIILGRTLPGTWNDGAERLALDINRTILFVSQQQGLPLSKGIYIFGAGAGEQLDTLRRALQIPVELIPAAEGAFDWTTEALRLRPASTPNFISPELQKAPQRQVFAKIVGAATIFAILASSALFVYASFQAHQEETYLKFLSARLTKLQLEHQDLTKRNTELGSKEELARLVVDERFPPVPAWFLGYLSEAVPSDLVVTNLQIQRQEQVWKVKLAGILQQPSRAEPGGTTLANAVAQLKLGLEGGPFHVRLAEEPKDKPPGSRMPAGTSGSGPSWLAGLSAKPPAPPPVPEFFVLEGVMQ